MSPATCCRSRSTASTPILYYNKDLFRAAGLDPEIAPKTWPEVGAAAKRLRASGRGLRLHHVVAVLDQCREFFRVSQPADLDPGPTASAASTRCLNFNNPVMVRHIAQLAEWQATKVFDYSGRAHVGGAALSERRMRHLHRLVGDPRRHQGQFEIRGRLRHVAVLARRRRRAAEHHHRRRDAVGAARPAARRIQGRRQVLRLPVEAGGSGRLAPEHRLSAGDPGGVRSDPRAGLLRSQSRYRDLDRADHAEAADRKFAGASGSARSC